MRKLWIGLIVVLAAALAAGLGVLIWVLVRPDADEITTIELEGSGFGGVEQRAAFTRIPGSGDLFWWFYPSQADTPTLRPTILWLDGVVGVPPSLSANIAMIGPYDLNGNIRNNSWVDDYNLLFVDAPLGTGFSTLDDLSNIPTSAEENAKHLVFALQSFYSLNEEFAETPLFIFGQGYGAQLALALAIELLEDRTNDISLNLKGIVLGSGIISPALALTKLGFYLEELGYIDGNGRDVIESLSDETLTLVSGNQLGEAFDNFLSLEDIVNERAGAIAINLGHIVEKLTQGATTTRRDYFGQSNYLQSSYRLGSELYQYMDDVVAPALGLASGSQFDSNHDAVVQAFRRTFMAPAVDKIEYILQNTDIAVTIYNGNLDAVSNTPGQLEWVENLQWSGQDAFRSSPRQVLVLNQQLEGYFRETDRLTFYWINAAGLYTPLDSPLAMRRVISRTTGD